MLKVYHSNRLENLLDRLVEVTETPLAAPLAAELIVTQSQGMARWLALGIAERRGIAANLQFVLPASFIWRLFVDQWPALSETSAFDRDALAWRLMDELPRHADQPGFEPLARYLQGERPELRRYQLCRRIADVFDQYLIYRPDLIHEWESGSEDDWQALLWRALTADGTPHRAGLLYRFLDEKSTLQPARLPERICLFGIPTLPPAYLQIVTKLATVIDIHLFALNPCLMYWGDIEDERHIARLRERRARLGRAGEDYLTSGNSLLASLGRQGRDFIDALHEVAAEEEESFAEPGSPGLLGIIQSDLLTLVERGRDAPRLPLDAADISLQVHRCHSPLREVEVLHDRLLAMFDADPALTPRDVVVMTPEIETYAPYIEAVFGAAPEMRRIPWAIADLSRQSEHPLVQAFLQLLDLPASRFTANDVLSLLELPAVLRRYRLEFGDFETIRNWVKESGVRWGLDGHARAELELPALDANTWAFGLRRLLLGYAMAPDQTRLFAGVLPYPHVEGQKAAVLGRLGSFVEQLAHFAGRLRRPHTAVEWVVQINELLEAFFNPDGDDAEPLQVVRDAVAGLVTETERGGFTEAFGIDLLRDYLRGQLTASNTEQRLLTGRLTFCAMIPMRSLPFRVIALIGMNDGAFPRQQRPLGFDRMARHPRRGDRSRREDDRYLFLEALISARELLYISYVGRNIRDNSPLLPSVLVAELLDYVDQAFDAGERPAHDAVTIDHPLQPFSDRYFRGEPELFSYADEWLPAIRARQNPDDELLPFCSGPLPAAAEPSNTIELSTLRRFFRHPARAFLRDRLGIWLNDSHEVLDDKEPFTLGGLERYQLHSEMLEYLLHGGDETSYRATLKARGDLPNSAFADLLLDNELAVVAELAERIRPHLSGALPPLEVDLALAGCRLNGWLSGLTTNGLLVYRAGNLKPADRLDLWTQHLVLNALAPSDVRLTSRLIGRDGHSTLAPVSDAADQLRSLIDLYRQGQLTPLALMPTTACAYATALVTGKEPRREAEKAWLSTAYSRGEDADPDFALAFRGRDPLDEQFEQLAEAVFVPLLNSELAGVSH